MPVTIKEIPMGCYLLSEHKGIMVQDINDVAQHAVPKLYAAAMQERVGVTGPTVFFYDMPGTAEKPFDLSVGLPVDCTARETASGIPIVEMPAVRCACLDHVGSMNEVQETYGKIFTALEAMHEEPTWMSREIYKRWITQESTDNVTELQVVLK